ncbi:MAG: YigZ family protein [Bacteroidota bacterium]|nr:YigZ family protein [Bacteroidota bacterium]
MKYLTIGEEGSAELKEKGSKFIAKASHIADENEIKNLLKYAKSEYPDSRHICYAYRLGALGEIHKADDNGEPAHSAGTPILNAIRSTGASDVLVYVVRYFGGTKLGISGLISAYKQSAIDALKQATYIEIVQKIRIQLECPFNKVNLINAAVKKSNCSIFSQKFNFSYLAIIDVPEETFTEFMNWCQKNFVQIDILK